MMIEKINHEVHEDLINYKFDYLILNYLIQAGVQFPNSLKI